MPALGAAVYFVLWFANYLLVAHYSGGIVDQIFWPSPRESAIIMLIMSVVVGYASGGLDDALEAVTCAMSGLGLVVVVLAAQMDLRV